MELASLKVGTRRRERAHRRRRSRPSIRRPSRTASSARVRSGRRSRPTPTSPKSDSSITPGRQEHDHPCRRSCSKRCRASSRTEFIKDAEAGFQRAPMCVRVSPYLLSLIDWADPYDDPLRTQFIPLASRLLPDHPKLDARLAPRAGRRAGPGPHAPLSATRRCSSRSTPARSIAGSARAATRSASTPKRSRRSSSRSAEERWERAFQYIASRPELEDIVVSGGDAYNSARRADHADRRRAPRDAEHPPHPLRDQGPGGDAAEAPHRQRVDRRAHRASSSAAASSTRKSCSTRTSTTRTRSPASPKRALEHALRARHHRAQPERCCSAASTTPSRRCSCS